MNHSRKNQVLDHFIEKTVLNKNEKGESQFDLFCVENGISENTRKLIEFIITKTTNVKVGVLKRVDYDSFTHNIGLLKEILNGDVFKQTLEIILRIENIINKGEKHNNVEGEDYEKIKNIGFSLEDIVKIQFKNGYEYLEEISQNGDAYLSIFGDIKYLIGIGKKIDGLHKIQKIKDCIHKITTIIEFNGYHLSQIVLGSGWEEKLNYFGDEEKLKRLKAAGFNGSHLSQIVLGSGWEEKLNYFEDDEKLKRLKAAGFNGSHLSQIVVNAGWEEKLNYFEDEKKLKRLKAAGFNGSHLSQIVLGAGWEEKLNYFEDEEKLKRLKAAGFNGYHLSQIVLGSGWEEKLNYFGDEEKLERLKAAGFNGYHLSQIVRNAGWEEKLNYFEDEEKLEKLRTHLSFDKIAKICIKKNWKEQLDSYL